MLYQIHVTSKLSFRPMSCYSLACAQQSPLIGIAPQSMLTQSTLIFVLLRWVKPQRLMSLSFILSATILSQHPSICHINYIDLSSLINCYLLWFSFLQSSISIPNIICLLLPSHSINLLSDFYESAYLPKHLQVSQTKYQPIQRVVSTFSTLI
jgi:hypothetical protein